MLQWPKSSRCRLAMVAATSCSLTAGAAFAQQVDARRAVVAVERIWDRAAHSAFTDLIRYQDRYFCAFREGSGHVPGLNGVIRVLVSETGRNWRSVARLHEAGVDLRDPKLSVTPDGRVMVVMGGSYYEGRTLRKREGRVAFSDPSGREFTAPQPIEIDAAIRTDVDWLWRVTWNGGVGYGVVYQPLDDAWGVHLVATKDGLSYRHVAAGDVDGRPNETTLRFEPDGRMVALMRREAGDRSAMIGTSAPPYDAWQWHPLGERLGGPNCLRLPDGTWIAAGRHYLKDGARTGLWRLSPDERDGFAWLLDLQSGGDTSYPGLVLDGEFLLVSYYSSHEGRSAIYLATLRWRELTGP